MAGGSPIVRIEVHIRTGGSLMAATDDPVFLGLGGPSGREFRLKPAHGRALRRGQEDHFVLGAPDDPETNVAHPELNDPTQPPLDAERLTSVYLRKGFEPVPNVRAVGEMDDRIQIEEADVTLHVEGRPKAVRYARTGPIWLGLVAGLRFELRCVDAGR